MRKSRRKHRKSGDQRQLSVPAMSPKALRKLARRLENERLTKQDAKAWAKVRSALRLGYDQPINRQARKDLSRAL